MIRMAPGATLFPYTTLFRSELGGGLDPFLVQVGVEEGDVVGERAGQEEVVLHDRADPAAPRACERRRQRHAVDRSEEHTSELQSRLYFVCRLLFDNIF